MHVEKNDGEFCVEASLVGELFGVSPSDMQTLMRTNATPSRRRPRLPDHGAH